MATSPVAAGKTPIVYIDALGIHRPTLQNCLDYVISNLQQIHGSDTYFGADSQDGQLAGLWASGLDDSNAMCVQAYNSFSPATAVGVGLSSVVKINGLARLVPSSSTAPMLIGGQAGTLITAGLVADANGNIWALPDPVVIPNAGQIIVTATCQTVGAVSAPVATINVIQNTQPGWQTATNTIDATPGAPVEQDGRLRLRQSQSTMNSSTAILQGIEGAVLASPGVTRARAYENEGNIPDAYGIPGHCIAVVEDGGDVQAIAQTIKDKKGGCGTYGDTSITIYDAHGFPSQVNFFELTKPPVTFAVTIKQLPGFTTDVSLLIQQAMSDWTNAIAIGANVQLTRAYTPAYLYGAPSSQTYEVQSIMVARDGKSPTPADVPINFYEAAFCQPGNVSVTVSNPLG